MKLPSYMLSEIEKVDEGQVFIAVETEFGLLVMNNLHLAWRAFWQTLLHRIYRPFKRRP